MKNIRWVLPLVACRLLCGQGLTDGCNSALDTLNRLKEAFFTDAESLDFGKAYSNLITATRNCPDSGELWYYRALLGKRGGAPASETEYSLATARKLKWSRASDAHWADLVPESKAADASLSGAPQNKWALVVGVGKFTDPKLPVLSSASDARELDDVLLDKKIGRFPDGNVQMLLDDHATVQNIRKGIGWLRQNAKANDLVLVYFASHGLKRQEDPNGVSYIAAYDSDLSTPATRYATSIQMVDLVVDLTRELQAMRVVLILDTCFSGDAGSAAGQDSVQELSVSREASFSEALRIFRAGAGRAVLTAGTADQESYQSATLGHGFFTYFIMKALRDSSGRIPLSALYQQVKAETENAVSKELGKKQTPLLFAGAGAGAMEIGASIEPPRRAAE